MPKEEARFGLTPEPVLLQSMAIVDAAMSYVGGQLGDAGAHATVLHAKKSGSMVWGEGGVCFKTVGVGKAFQEGESD
jgi:hypothetical protein